MKGMYKKGGKSTMKKKESFMEESKEIHFGNPKKKYGDGGPGKQAPASTSPKNDEGYAYYPSGSDERQPLSKAGEALKSEIKGERARPYNKKKTGGAKSMEPGGGGRFAKMVKGLKKEGKSEDSAKAIAASIGRKKYGKSRFQAMANAGKKKMGGANC